MRRWQFGAALLLAFAIGVTAAIPMANDANDKAVQREAELNAWLEKTEMRLRKQDRPTDTVWKTIAERPLPEDSGSKMELIDIHLDRWWQNLENDKKTAPERRDRCVVMENGSSWNCFADETQIIMEKCPMFHPKKGCADRARQAIDQIEIDRMRAESPDGIGALMDINAAAVKAE